MLFESVRSQLVQEALSYLKENNPFYSDILIKLDNISSELLSLSDPETIVDQDLFPVKVEDDENLEQENPLTAESANSDELCVIPNFFNPDLGILNIAPGENKKPECYFSD